MNVNLVSNMIQKMTSTITSMQTRLKALEDGAKTAKPKVDEDVTLVYNGQKEQQDIKEQLDEFKQRLEYLETDVREVKQSMKQLKSKKTTTTSATA